MWPAVYGAVLRDLQSGPFLSQGMRTQSSPTYAVTVFNLCHSLE